MIATLGCVSAVLVDLHANIVLQLSTAVHYTLTHGMQGTNSFEA